MYASYKCVCVQLSGTRTYIGGKRCPGRTTASLTNNFEELEDEVISSLPPRVIENAMPQLSVPFIVDKLKEFAVSSTHKELDRIQSEFTTQASSPAPNEPVHPPPQTPHLPICWLGREKNFLDIYYFAYRIL